jgi:hypothetical protein
MLDAVSIMVHPISPDMTIIKPIPIATERSQAQLRGEFFNIFNQVNFNNPDTDAPSGSLECTTGAQSGHAVKLALKLRW